MIEVAGVLNAMKSYEFTTKNLGFRLLTVDDLPYLEKLYGDPEVTQFLSAIKKDQLKKVLHTSIENQKKGIPSFILFTLASNEFVGRAGFAMLDNGEIEVAYILQKKFWGQGYATEALEALLDFAKKNIKADYVIAYTPLEHHASQRVLQKCGMVHYKDDRDKGESCRFYRKKLK